MGCSSSVERRGGGNMANIQPMNVQGTVQIQDLMSMGIKRRHGHPTHYRADGYDVGLRVRVKGALHSTFVGCAKASGEKVSIEEHHLRNYPNSSNNQQNKKVTQTGENVACNEAMVLSHLNHPNLPELKEVFCTDASVFLITSYVDPFRLSNFIDLIENKSQLSMKEVQSIAKSLFKGLAHAHDQGVIIRDLTPSSIMYRPNADQVEVIIADLALAVPNGSLQILADHPLFDWAMVPYTAPEALLGHPYSCLMDCWAVGVLLYVMISARLPFNHNDDHVLIQTIKAAKFNFHVNAFEKLSDDGKDFISSAN